MYSGIKMSRKEQEGTSPEGHGSVRFLLMYCNLNRLFTMVTVLLRSYSCIKDFLDDYVSGMILS